MKPKQTKTKKFKLKIKIQFKMIFITYLTIKKNQQSFHFIIKAIK